MKKIFCSILASLMVISMVAPCVSAAGLEAGYELVESTKQESNVQLRLTPWAVPPVLEEGLPASTIKHIDSVFKNKANITIFDADSNDITEEFFARHDEHYKNRDIQAIVDDLGWNGMTIMEANDIEIQTQSASNVTRGIVTKGITASVTQYYVNINGTRIQYYVKINAAGAYKVNTATGKITGASTPTLVSSTSNAGSGYYRTLGQKNPMYKIGANNTTVTFTIPYESLLYANVTAVPLGFAYGSLIFIGRV